MTGINHGMTGAVLAVVLKEPALAVPLAYVSHFVCDSLPHFGLKEAQLFKPLFNTILLLDFLTALLMMWVLGAWFADIKWVVWASMIAAASPDLMWAYYEFIKRKNKRKPVLGIVARIHTKVQWSQSTPGLLVEIAWFGIMFFILSKLRANLS